MTANRLVLRGRLAVARRRRAKPVRSGTSCRPRRESSATTGTRRSAGLRRTAARRRDDAFRTRASFPRTSGAPRPGSAKMDCFSSPTAKTVRFSGARAGAGEKLGAQRGKNAPLRRRRVLGFVEQQVIEPIVELVQHPGGARPRHQRQRPRDLIVEIERAALGLHPREGRQDRSCDDEQGGAALQRQRRASALAQSERGDPARDADRPRAPETFRTGRWSSPGRFRLREARPRRPP